MFAKRVLGTRQDNRSFFDAVAAHPAGANLLAGSVGAPAAADGRRRCAALAAALHASCVKDGRGPSIMKDDDSDVEDGLSIEKDDDVGDNNESSLSA